MVLTARTSPAPAPGPEPGPSPEPRLTPLQLARGVSVVAGGPALLATGSARAPGAAARRWPDLLQNRAARRAAWLATAGGLLAPWVYALGVRPWLQTWGSTPDERDRRYPGDPDRPPLYSITRAVTIDAPATEVWQWLVQIGQDRGGFYSYDWLENLAGCRLHSADRIRPELQRLAPGDKLAMMPGLTTTFTEVNPPHWLLIENWGAYVVEPVDEHRCRLVARAHVERSAGSVGYIVFIELPHAVMERKMLLGIKKRAEAHHGAGEPGALRR